MSAPISSRLLEDDLQERRRAGVAGRPQIGDGLHLQFGLADAGREHRAAERARAGLENDAGRREVIGEVLWTRSPARNAGRVQRAREAPVIAAVALRLVDRAGRREDARELCPAASRSARRTAAPRFCSSIRSDLRVTGSCASAARLVDTARGSTSASMRGIIRARSPWHARSAAPAVRRFERLRRSRCLRGSRVSMVVTVVRSHVHVRRIVRPASACAGDSA